MRYGYREMISIARIMLNLIKKEILTGKYSDPHCHSELIAKGKLSAIFQLGFIDEEEWSTIWDKIDKSADKARKEIEYARLQEGA